MRRETRFVAAAVALLLGACRQDMHDQPRLKPQRESAFFADGAGARPLPAHTVARGDLREDALLWTGRGPDGALATALPPALPLSRALLERGRERYGIYCTPCHDTTGGGRGMVVRRGFKQPPSFHSALVRSRPLGHFVDVMTNGFGAMSSHASVLPPADRWAIAAYLRALQLSQHADAAALPAAERARLDAPAGTPTPPGGHGEEPR